METPLGATASTGLPGVLRFAQNDRSEGWTRLIQSFSKDRSPKEKAARRPPVWLLRSDYLCVPPCPPLEEADGIGANAGPELDAESLDDALREDADGWDDPEELAIALNNAGFAACGSIFAATKPRCTACCDIAERLRMLPRGIPRPAELLRMSN